MITVRIGDEVRKADDGGVEQWIAQRIEGMRREGNVVCVRVIVDEPDAKVTLATAGCSGGAGIARPLSGREQALLAAWRDRRLSDVEFAPGNLIAFLRQAARGERTA